MRGLDPRIHLVGKTISAKPIVANKRWTRGSSPRVTLWHKVLHQTKTASCMPHRWTSDCIQFIQT